jgi:PadR family transcriptional regulator, regulatory protein AphA
MTAATAQDSQPVVPELTPPAYVVLGMVRLGARSGYEIKQTVEQSIRFFWTISPVQIYPSLVQLEEAGLIAGRADPQGKRRRRTYEITPAGEIALREWLRRAEPMPFELRDIGLVKLFFADALNPAEARELLSAVTRRSEDRIATLQAIEPIATAAEEEGNVYPLLTLRMGLAYHQAMVDVCQDFAHKLQACRNGTDPAPRT